MSTRTFWFRWMTRLILIALLTSALPDSPRAAAAAERPATSAAAPAAPARPVAIQPPVLQSLPPLAEATEPARPALALDLQVAPDPLAVGATAALTLTVTNSAAAPADDLQLALPLPAAALALPGPGYDAPRQGWRWSLGRLEGHSSATVTATLRLLRRPPGDALPLAPAATARDLALPVRLTTGALVQPEQVAQAAVAPGRAAGLRSADGRVTVELPAQAHARPLTIHHTPLAARQPAQRAAAPPDTIGFKRGLGVFFLDATDDTGADVHQFAAPLTIRVAYTPEQLAARRIAEDDLTLFWFDDAQQRWVALPTTVDAATQTASATVDHFTPFQLGDGSSPSTAFIPSLKGWQTSLLTGAASYGMPIEVPAGAGGMRPQLQLTYSSATQDGGGSLHLKQAGWVGMGWDLSTGAIALNKHSGDNDSYSLILNGQSSDLVRGAALPGSPYSTNHLQGWVWSATDEQFLKVRYQATGPNNAGVWLVWTRDGVQYEFAEQAFWGWGDCTNGVTTEPYKWLLSRATDPSGNTITYRYDRLTQSRSCGVVTDVNLWPTEITWGGNLTTGAPARYRVEFVSAPRRSDGSNNVAGTEDMAWDYASNQYGGELGAPHETRKLTAINVWSMPASSWQLVRQYRFGYDFSLYGESYLCSTSCDDATGTGFSADPAYRKLTLRSITQVGADGVTALPATSLDYGTSRGSSKRALGGWNRLTLVDNGQGGRLTFGYENIAEAYRLQGAGYYNSFFNRHRVTSKLLDDGQGRQTLTRYSFTGAALNALGNALVPNSGPSQYPNSAALYRAYRTNTMGSLSVGDRKEFRGHYTVLEQTYDGPTSAAPLLQQIKHWFYQGNVGCTPAQADDSDACFVQLRDRELVKGREYLTQVYATDGSTLLQETSRTFASEFYANSVRYGSGYPQYPDHGLWRAFRYERQTEVKTYEGSATPLVQTTTFGYAPAYQTLSSGQSASTHYGNLGQTDVAERGALTRSTRRWYTTRDDESWNWGTSPPSYSIRYIVDRSWAESVYDGGGNLLAMSQSFYDDIYTAQRNTPWYIGTKGQLTRSSVYRGVPAAPSAQDVTLYSQDSTYTYDAYGNRISVTVMSDWGTRLKTASGWNISLAGGDSPSRGPKATLTDYDPVFHAFPVQETNPLGHVTRADYDGRMGLLIRVTGPNTSGTPTDCRAASYSIPASEETTCAQYDLFGRMTRLVKPGDSTAYPTAQISYYDAERPVRYRVDRREAAGQAGTGVTQIYYDGLGQQIQTKRESVDGAQNIVTDTRYNALGQPAASSQPRYVNQSGAAFLSYTAPGGALFNPTSTSFDGLGRPVLVTAPDGSTSTTGYRLGSLGTIARSIDANGHQTERESDLLGRLRTVTEYAGNNGSEGAYSVAATTRYTYTALDLLASTTDALGNQITISYDSLGRKTSMRDPDMGAWSYDYDVNGNLTRQTDALGQTIGFGYDALDRLTSKTLPGGRVSSYAYDDASAPNQGRGQRTSMATYLGASMHTYARWEYDARGRTTLHVQSAAGVLTQLTTTYDSADRPVTLTYGPGGETVRTTYDAAGRPATLCSSLAGQPCYVTGATYTALDQPDARTTGNGVLQDWSYDGTTTRLSRLTVGSAFDRSYGYDRAANLTSLTDNLNAANSQTFGYDARDRLTCWRLNSASCTQSYTYDAIGNLTSKTGTGTLRYGSTGSGTGSGPHQARTVGSTAYTYDANGNLASTYTGTSQSGTGRRYTWLPDNMLLSVEDRVTETSSGGGGCEAICPQGATPARGPDTDATTQLALPGTTTTTYTLREQYAYDADGERVVRVADDVATVYFADVWEQTTTGAITLYYPFNGQPVALRSSAGVTYLHGDHLGSVSLATNSAGALASRQEFDPWGAVRSGGVSQTTRNYTGQRLDGTGLLYYHARMYDPRVGRFLSADSVVPGNAAGGMDGVALKPLTVDFHETGFVAALNTENGQPFWFQMGAEERERAGAPWGPANAQALNRYSYVQNNPLKYTDPSGHARKYTFSTGQKDLFSAIIGKHRTRAAAGWAAVAVVVGSAAGVGCGLISGGIAAVACGVATGGLVAAGGVRTDMDYDRVVVTLEKAKLFAGDQGSITVTIDPKKNTITFTGKDGNGRIKHFTIEGVDAITVAGMISAGDDLNRELQDI